MTLGWHIPIAALPTEEALIAFRCLTTDADRNLTSIEWLSCCKAAKWLGIDPPSRFDQREIDEFVKANRRKYFAARELALRS